MVTPAMQLASKIPDLHLQLWSSAILKGVCVGPSVGRIFVLLFVDFSHFVWSSCLVLPFLLNLFYNLCVFTFNIFFSPLPLMME